MKFPLSLDLRSKTLELNELGVRVIDADQTHVMTFFEDVGGRFDLASQMVDILNVLHGDTAAVRDIAVEVYKKLLDASCKGDAQRMLDKDRENDPDDNGKKLRGRARMYDAAVSATLEVLSERRGS